MRRVPLVLLPAVACAWLLVVCLAPLALRDGTAPLATVAVYKTGSLLCHQKPERSFRLAGAQMPVCARCFGLYASAAVGVVAALFAARRSSDLRLSTARIALAVTAVPMLLSVGLEWSGLIDGSNASRFTSALPLGATAAWILQRTILATAPRTFT